MKFKVVSVYDSQLELYSKPFFMQTRGTALRSWADSVNDPQSPFHQHPDDYTLFEIAEYDEETGRFENYATPVSLGVAIEFKKGHVPLPQGMTERKDFQKSDEFGSQH